MVPYGKVGKKEEVDFVKRSWYGAEKKEKCLAHFSLPHPPPLEDCYGTRWHPLETFLGCQGE